MIHLNLQQVHGLQYSFESDEYDTLRIYFHNTLNGRVVHRVINKGTVDKINIHYLVPWHIKMYDLKGNLVKELRVDYKDSNVGIIFGSTALGDTLAWVPQVDKWVKKNKPAKLYLHTSWNYIFDKTKYSDRIVWVDKKEELANYTYNTYFCLGVSKHNQTPSTAYYDHANPVCWKLINMLRIATDPLGLEPIEIKPHLVRGSTDLGSNYITLCTESSQSIKMIHSPKVWLEFIKWANFKGFHVKELGIKPSILPGVEAHKGIDIIKTIDIMRSSNLHIGVSSGLSWLAWALDKPVIMIGNFTDPTYEFSSKLIRVVDSREIIGLFNDVRYKWLPEFNYDPLNDNQAITTVFDPIRIREFLSNLNIMDITGFKLYDCNERDYIDLTRP